MGSSRLPGLRRPPSAGQNLYTDVCKLLEEWRHASPHYAMAGDRNIWICKPAGRARGEGIFLSSNIEDILHCAQSQRGMTTWICQKYIESPLLLTSERKHDLRQWVLVTSWRPLTIWFYEECYVRLAAEAHDLEDTSSKLRHLCNNAITCHHPEFDGNDDTWSCMWEQSKYKRFLQQKYGPGAWENKVLPGMHRAVIETLKAVSEPLANSVAASCCFEFLGFDFMVDSDLHVWLLEVNTSPCMEYSTQVTSRLVPLALEDTLKVVLQEDEANESGFQLLYKDYSMLEEPAKSSFLTGYDLRIEGRAIRRSAPVEAVVDTAESSRHFAQRRSDDLARLTEKKKQQKEKVLQKKERQKRLENKLRQKVLAARRLCQTENETKVEIQEGGHEVEEKEEDQSNTQACNTAASAGQE